MKKILLIIACIAPAMVWGQEKGFVLKVKMDTHGAPAIAHLYYAEGDKAVSDSARIKDGVFEFKGLLSEPVMASVEVDHEGVGLVNLKGGVDMLQFYLEKGNNNMIAKDSVKLATIPGSKLNEEDKTYKTLIHSTQEKISALYRVYSTASAERRNNKEFEDSLNTAYNEDQRELLALRTQFIKRYPNSYVSLNAYKEIANPQADLVELDTLYKCLSPGLRNTSSGRELATAIAAAKATAVGVDAPLFSMEDVNGQMVSLKSFRGKYVLLDFWASWCGPCRKENPNVVAAYQHFKDKNFTIVGVSLDAPGKKDAWLAAIKADGLDWTQLSDLKYWHNAVVKQYGVRSIPQNYLIDPGGKIIAKNLRGEELDKKLASLFN